MDRTAAGSAVTPPPRVQPAAPQSAQFAKAALQRLASARLEPTPENYARAWLEAGGPAAEPALPTAAHAVLERLVARALPEDRAMHGELLVQLMRGRWNAAAQQIESISSTPANWATLIEQVVRGVERGSRHWTSARKRDSLRHVLEGSRSDPVRLRERLKQLLASWEGDAEGGGVEAVAAPLAAPSGAVPAVPAVAGEGGAARPDRPSANAADASTVLHADLMQTVRSGLPDDDAAARELSVTLAAQAARLAGEGAQSALVAEIADAGAQARVLFARRHHLVGELTRLVHEMTGGLTELAEDESWAQGQAQALREHLGGADGAPTVRGVRAAGSLLAHTRRHQQELKAERDRARGALRALVASLMKELASLGGHTGQFGDDLARYTETLERDNAPDALAEVVHDMLAKARAVQTEVADAGARLAAGQAEAVSLTSRVQELEGELRRLADEASTDALTQVSNRRGLQQAFEQERARCEREGSALAVALIDIDNFKRLNDSLGHAAGDEALKALATQMRAALRPLDHVARFGGEEFALLLPGLAADEAGEVLTRLQRQLSMSLFIHEGRDVFVTFSAGVTAWRTDEGLDAVIERADSAMYEAKRTGKNRTCVS